jgi:hypothetical protein
MAKYFNGSIEFPSALLPSGTQPLDDRTVVKTFNDLLDKNTFLVNGSAATYPGMSVSVIDENKIYVLKGTPKLDKDGQPINDELIASDHTQKDNWVAIGSSDLSGELADISGRVDGLEGRIEDAEAVLENIPYPVTDVKVNGETVVKDGVAEITIDTGLTADAVQGLIDSSFNEFVGKVTENETVDTFKELIDYAAEHKSEIGDLVAEVDKKIDSISVNGVDATVANGAASVKIEADDIELGTAITSDGEVANEDGSNVIHAVDTKLSIVLQGIYDSISGAEAGGVHAIVAADKSVLINSANKNNPTVKVQLSTNANNLLSVDETGLFAAMYYEGDDE